MSELSNPSEVTIAVTRASVKPTKETIPPRRTVVYQTLIDPAVIRIKGERIKNKLFKRFLFNVATPEEIELVSIEKYYEPFIVVSGRYIIDYFRKVTYSVKVDSQAKEVILFGRTFTPRETSVSSANEHSIWLDGEERLTKDLRSFIVLNRNGGDTKLNEFPSAPSEENAQELIESLKMPEVAADIDLEVIRKRIVQRPKDVNRVVSEEFEIDERTLIYTPRFRLTYKCPRINKEAYMDFDGVTSKQIKRNEGFVATVKAALLLPKRLFDEANEI